MTTVYVTNPKRGYVRVSKMIDDEIPVGTDYRVAKRQEYAEQCAELRNRCLRLLVRQGGAEAVAAREVLREVEAEEARAKKHQATLRDQKAEQQSVAWKLAQVLGV